MKITVSHLRDLNACESGIAEFTNLVGPNGFEGEWTYQHQIALMLSSARGHMGFLVQNRLIPVFSMREADLEGANLGRADLNHCPLSDQQRTEALGLPKGGDL